MRANECKTVNVILLISAGMNSSCIAGIACACGGGTASSHQHGTTLHLVDGVSVEHPCRDSQMRRRQDCETAQHALLRMQICVAAAENQIARRLRRDAELATRLGRQRHVDCHLARAATAETHGCFLCRMRRHRTGHEQLLLVSPPTYFPCNAIIGLRSTGLQRGAYVTTLHWPRKRSRSSSKVAPISSM